MVSQVNSRRTTSTAVSGVINFPVEGSGYTNTGVGGMYVQLVAIEKRSDAENWWEDAFIICWGGSNTTIDYQETLAGTDTLVDERIPYTPANAETWDEEVAKVAYATNSLFPLFFSEEKSKDRKYRSIPLLASMVIGSTGASWMNGDNYWRCTYDDLDLQGRAIYDQMQALYGAKASLHLVTWVDEG